MACRSFIVLMGAAALAVGAAAGCEREVAREETIERRNGVVEERREVETVDPVRDERRTVEEERRIETEPRD